MSKARIYFELLRDRPQVISYAVGRLALQNLSITDISYSIDETDSGHAACTIYVDNNDHDPAIQTKAETVEREAKTWIANHRPAPVYERWFRRPSLRLSLVAPDRVGVVRDLLDHLEYTLTQRTKYPIGNILDLKGFTVDDHGLFALSLQVATTGTSEQAVLIKAFFEWCKDHKVKDFDVQFVNFIYDYTERADRG